MSRVIRAGAQHPNAKLTNEQVLEIARLAGSMPQRALADKYGVSRTVISSIVHGRAYTSVTGKESRRQRSV